MRVGLQHATKFELAAPPPEKALTGIRKLALECVTDMLANGEQIPEPFAMRRYSGKFKVRIPPEAHRALAVEAAEANVSLNRLIASKLSHAH